MQIKLAAKKLHLFKNLGSVDALQLALSNERDNKVRKSHGTTPLGVLLGRVTRMIDGNGVVGHVFSLGFHPEKYAREATVSLEKLGNPEKTSSCSSASHRIG